MPLTYSDLRELQRKERESATLFSLPKEYFSQVFEFLRERKSSISTDSSISELREFDNVQKTVKDIISLRQKKILFRALKGAEHDSSGMTEEEHKLYDEVRECLKKTDDGLDFAMQAQKQEEKTPLSVKKVRFLKDIPAYKGSQLKTYGPFKKDEVAALPGEEASFLVGAKMAEET
ncbi:hypothetical protein COV61_04865 [Candidatus Micrarchaeota archaeon CG11_big_fil_rev_8_21_14_0_20_47_5]|nr:MAG: hypothetical protein AUJ17_02735 [Candidatus Micrarchaeota archaeon CG1_02_47_40]PIN82816.1 MAG: hypothetical protein COV61_04865 [Candidatus Micrarchaeota archaeon CG11_big_fil_rev_8_21_14_0_20_47_5]